MDSSAQKAFLAIKQKLTEALVLRHLDLSKVLEVTYNAIVVEIGNVSGQDGHPITYFNEILNQALSKLFVIGDIIYCHRSSFLFSPLSPSLPQFPA